MNNEIRVKKLSNEIRKNGFDYKLIKRTEEKCLYAQYTKLGVIVAYEVFKTKLSTPHPKSLKDVENFDKVEIFPSDEEFGVRAWTFKTVKQAEHAFLGKNNDCVTVL